MISNLHGKMYQKLVLINFYMRLWSHNLTQLPCGTILLHAAAVGSICLLMSKVWCGPPKLYNNALDATASTQILLRTAVAGFLKPEGPDGTRAKGTRSLTYCSICTPSQILLGVYCTSSSRMCLTALEIDKTCSGHLPLAQPEVHRKTSREILLSAKQSPKLFKRWPRLLFCLVCF